MKDEKRFELINKIEMLTVKLKDYQPTSYSNAIEIVELIDGWIQFLDFVRDALIENNELLIKFIDEWEEKFEGEWFLNKLDIILNKWKDDGKLYQMFQEIWGDEFVTWFEGIKDLLATTEGGQVLMLILDSLYDLEGVKHETLEQRLNRDFNFLKNGVTTDFIIKNDLIHKEGVVTVNGFYGNDNQYKYEVKKGVNEYKEVKQGLFIDDNLNIKINDGLYLKPFFENRSVSLGSLGCNSKNDSKIFQLVMNYVIKNKMCINIDVDIDIDNPISVDRVERDRYQINIYGNGVMNLSLVGSVFDNFGSDRNSGNIVNRDYTVIGDNSKDQCFYNGEKIIRTKTKNVMFDGVNTILKDDNTGSSYVQSHYFDLVTILRSKGILFNFQRGYDIDFGVSLVEQCNRFLRCPSPQSVRIHHSTIEGLDGYVSWSGSGRGLTFQDNYFEACDRVNFEGYFVYRNDGFGFDYDNKFSFKDNVIIGTVEQRADYYYAFRIQSNLPKGFINENNTSDINMYVVTNIESCLANTDFIERTLNEGIRGKYSFGKAPVIQGYVEKGSGNMYSKTEKPFSTSDFNLSSDGEGSTIIFTNNDGSLTLINKKGGSKNSGLTPKEMVYLNTNTWYVLGLKIMSRNNNQGSIIFRLFDENGITAYEQRFKPHVYVTGKTSFFSLYPFKIKQNGKYSVSLQQEHDTPTGIGLENGFTLDGMWLQKGVVATEFSRGGY